MLTNTGANVDVTIAMTPEDLLMYGLIAAGLTLVFGVVKWGASKLSGR